MNGAARPVDSVMRDQDGSGRFHSLENDKESPALLAPRPQSNRPARERADKIRAARLDRLKLRWQRQSDSLSAPKRENALHCEPLRIPRRWGGGGALVIRSRFHFADEQQTGRALAEADRQLV